MASVGVLILRAQRRARAGRIAAFDYLDGAIAWLASRRLLAILFVGLAPILLRIALVPVIGIPQPQWNDEFSYLLASDTFSHGRVTSPPHPMWIHFETFHEIQHPTYMSMYPPAEGLALAAGQFLWHPWLGQLLITGAMCSVLCWMLQAWLPPKWALLAALLAALRLAVLSYWMNTYWCASIAALGGALVLGAWPRIRKRMLRRDALLLGLGLVVLANSRPYEGLVFSIPVAIAMLLWIARGDRRHWKHAMGTVVVPVFAVLVVGGVATGLYYHRVTGSAFRLAYQVNRAQYATAPYFIWQTPRPEPEYHHAVIRDYYRWELGEFERNRTFTGYITRAGDKLFNWWQFYLGPLLSIPLLALPWIIHQRRMALPILICAALALGFAVQTWTFPHYFSPATGALYILLAQGLRHIRVRFRRRQALGRSLVRAVFAVACTMISLRVVAVATHTHVEPEWPRGNLERARVVAELRALPGSHLVLVRYGDHHNVDHEWVWNDASIDASKIVWARDMGSHANQELLNYFPARQAWALDGDEEHPVLSRYAP